MEYKIGDVIRRTAKNGVWIILKFVSGGVLVINSIREEDIGRVFKDFQPEDYRNSPDWILDESCKVSKILENYDN